MSKITDDMLAFRVADWLQKHHCTVQVLVKEDGVHVHYTLKADMKPQPPIRVQNGSIIFPVGSQEDVIFAFLSQ